MLLDFLISLIPEKKRGLWSDYLKFADMGSSRFVYEEGKESIKEEKLRLLEKAMRREIKNSANILACLQQEFIKENLSISLLTDWLTVWKYTSVLKSPLNEKQISDIIGYIVSPLTRMIVALNDENPSIYLPFAAFVSATVFLRMTEEKSELLKGGKWSLKQRKSKLKGWLKNSRVLLSVVGSKRLKFRLAMLLNRVRLYESAFLNNKQCNIGMLDEIKIFLYSIWQFITVRHKSVTIKGL